MSYNLDFSTVEHVFLLSHQTSAPRITLSILVSTHVAVMVRGSNTTLMDVVQLIYPDPAELLLIFITLRSHIIWPWIVYEAGMGH